MSVEQQKRKTVVFCLPGRTYSGDFLKSWTMLIHAFSEANFEIVLSQAYNSVVHFARAKCLGADVTRGVDQVPFGGKLAYDYLMWIDSDVIFHPNQILQLIKDAEEKNKNVVCGYYMMEDRVNFATVPTCDDEYFAKHATYQFLTSPSLDKIKEERKDSDDRLLKVDYTGLGFALFKHGVFEKLKYPWFYHPLETVKSDDPDKPTMVDMVSEDASLFKNLKKIGEEVYINIDVRVGHEKVVVL